MIKLVAKKKIGFRNPETKEIIVATPYAFETMPDWIKNDPMYSWALKDKTIEVTESTEEKATAQPAKGTASKTADSKKG